MAQAYSGVCGTPGAANVTSATTAARAGARPRLSVEPADALIDVPRRIALAGLAPGETVRLESATARGATVWRSQATFRADAKGTVDLRRDAPLEGGYGGCGGYAGVHELGLIWSQTPEAADQRALFPADARQPLVTHITANITANMAGNTAASTASETGAGTLQATLTQRLAGPGVTRREVREDGLVGTLYLPPGDGPHPAVIVLNGSGGGINEPRAALYASHGYAAFALAYFKAPGLSGYISNTPLEYFKTGLDWVRRQVRPAGGFVALSGQSRGGELALLLATLFPADVSAVLAYVPGAVVHGGQAAADPAVGRDGPAWLYRGQALPYVWQNNRTATWAPYDEGPPPHRNERAIRTALLDSDAVARSRIRVEKIRAPVLLLSGTDDGSLPSSVYTRMVADKLAEVGHPYPVERLDFEGVGHSILFPCVPTTQLFFRHPVSGRDSSVGGTPRANAEANEQSWRAARRFLARAVRDHTSSPSPSSS